jgi:hypothetical protein
LVKALFDHSTVEDSQKWMEHGPNLFVMVLPPGESSAGVYGMSGSPVFMKGKLAGILVAASSINVGGRTVDVAYFHGIDGIRKALKDPMTIMRELLSPTLLKDMKVHR